MVLQGEFSKMATVAGLGWTGWLAVAGCVGKLALKLCERGPHHILPIKITRNTKIEICTHGIDMSKFTLNTKIAKIGFYRSCHDKFPFV